MSSSSNVSSSGNNNAPPPDAVLTEFAVVIDTREQLPWTFGGLWSDSSARGGRRPIVVDQRVATLQQGDYSLVGHESQVAIERKSLADLFGTLGQGRERFERELARLAELDRAAIVIEASLGQIFPAPCLECSGTGFGWDESPCATCGGTGKRSAVPHSRLNPKTVFRSYLAWSIEYPTISWHWADSRRVAEVLAFRWLARWHKVRAPLLAGGETLEQETASPSPSPAAA